MNKYLSVIVLLIGAARAQNKLKLCAPETILESTCNALQRSRSESRVSCIRVTDSAECAIKLAEGKADFGIFNAEEMLLAYQFYPDVIQPITQLRHIDRIKEDYEFQSVAIVPSSFNGRNGLAGLKNAGFCHPGFSDAQLWNDRVLKHFEKRVYDSWCRNDLSASENEADNLKNFFGTACRPGEWVADDTENRYLKSKYPELCELCNDKHHCEYQNTAHHGHFGALECLVSGRGNVTYVAYEYVRQFFGLNSNVSISPLAIPVGFQFLCADGTTRPLTSDDPCSWIRQPWKAILARKEKSREILEGLKNWLSTGTNNNDDGDDDDATNIINNGRSAQDWTVALKLIIESDDARPIYFSQDTMQSLKTYLANGREVDLSSESAAASATCGETIRWCTISPAETNKCNWIAREALALGIEPTFSCVIGNSTFHCLKLIADDKADIITIDSNYGHVARQVFNLTTVMYTETESDRNSIVIAIVREDATNKITSFRDMKKRTACFPEYAAISWLSFLNTVRMAKIISDSCDYPRIVSEFFSRACTPGIRDVDHHRPNSPISSAISDDEKIASILCSLCPAEATNLTTCSANENNYYYGDKGALECIKEGAGDVAFVEANNLLLGNIDGKKINPNDYRVLCKNGSLAIYTGFNIDEPCALSVTIDSEVIGRKNETSVFTKDVTLALMKIENWLGYRAQVLRPIRIYDSFTGSSDLLFKDTTVGLVSTSSEIKTVLAYKELFSHVDYCTSGVRIIVANLSLTILSILLIISVALFHR